MLIGRSRVTPRRCRHHHAGSSGRLSGAVGIPRSRACRIVTRQRSKAESPQRSEEIRPCRPASDDQDRGLEECSWRPPSQSSRTASDQHQPASSRAIAVWPPPAAYADARSRSTARAGAGYPADHGPGRPGRRGPIAAAEPPRDDMGDGVARRPGSAADARARCRSWRSLLVTVSRPTRIRWAPVPGRRRSSGRSGASSRRSRRPTRTRSVWTLRAGTRAGLPPGCGSI